MGFGGGADTRDFLMEISKVILKMASLWLVREAREEPGCSSVKEPVTDFGAGAALHDSRLHIRPGPCELTQVDVLGKFKDTAAGSDLIRQRAD